MSKLLKSILSIGTFIIIVMLIPYIAIFIMWLLFSIAAIGLLAWGGFKIVKGVKNIMFKVSSKENIKANTDMFSNTMEDSQTMDIDYEDSVIIDVDYENIE